MKFMALIKFEKTGNIYFGCYDTVTDILYPRICTPDECYDDKQRTFDFRRLCSGFDSEDAANSIMTAEPSIDKCEMWTGYAQGMHWNGKGDEKNRVVIKGTDPWEENDPEDGTPDWAVKFLKIFFPKYEPSQQ